MDLPYTNVILGVQWLSVLGPITTNYKTMEMSFNGENGKRVILKGMSGNAPRVVTTKCVEAIFRRADIVYAAECLVSVQVDKEGHPQYSHDIQRIIDNHNKEFEPIPQGKPPDRRFDHIIELEKGAKPVITTPYRHPKKYKYEIEKSIK